MINILIVDDKTENLYLLQSLLDTNGFRTISARNGAEALGLMRNNIPDLIITDILMPVMDGFTLCRECKKDEILKNIPFFFYTATYTDSKDEEYALSLGADRFVLKPQEPDVFLKILNDFLDEVREKNIRPKKVIQQDETIVLKEYNEVLIRKIEDKMLQTEKSEKELRKYAEKLEKEINEHKISEALILEREQQLSLIYRTVGDVIFHLVVEADDTYRFISVNQAFFNVTGLREEMIIGKLVNEVIPEPSLSIVLEKYRQAIKDNSIIQWEEVSDYPNGKVIGDVSIAPVVDNSGKCTHLVGSVHDITIRKRAEEALAVSETKYRQLVTQSPDGIFIVDLSGKFLSVNRSICDNLKYTEKELLSKNIFDIVPEQYHSTHKQRLQTILKGESTITNSEYEVVGKDGIAHFVEVLSVPYYSGKEIVGFQGIARDITERKNAEMIIVESEEKYHRIFENVQDLYYETAMDGRIIEVSPSIRSLSGGQYSREDLIGNSIYEFYSDTEDRLSLLSALKEKGQVNDFEITLKNKNGSLIPCSVSAKIHLDLRGNPEKIIGSMRDISERKLAESELIKAKNKAEESDRLKTAFLHNISHEVRTPMNAIVGFSELIAEPDLSQQMRNEFVQTIVQSSNQLLSIITQIVSMATIEAGQEKIYEKEISLNSIFKMVSEQFSSVANKKNISLKYNTALPDHEDKIITDETKLIQIISNLMSNACKFTKQGRIDFGYEVKGRYLEFYFKDSGIGIPQNMFEKIFERFRQVESTLAREYEGAGLGLSISKAYVELLGGKIWLSSKLGEGSVFYFTIPYNKVKMVTTSEKEAPGKNKSVFEKTITLLVAEDEDNNFMLLTQYLSNANIIVLHAVNGSEAVEICKKNRQINLVLMDLKMPVMDGYEATKIIKGFRPDLPIIAQTAYSLDTDKFKSLTSGCCDFISKPFKKEALLAMIREHLAIQSLE